MAEIRLKSTGTIKLFENDNTSNVTIASPASLGADRTITLPDASVTLASGTMLATDGSGASLTALNASELGSGTVPTARLGSGTASSSTVLYGDQTYKTEPTGGKVLQVQSNTFTAGIQTSNTSYEATAVFDQITPSATDSKILIWIDGGRASYGSGAAEGSSSLYRQIGGGGFSSLRVMHLDQVNEAGGYGKPSCAFNYIDTSHNTTSAIDYKVYIKTNANTYHFNSGSSQIGIILMEMAA